MSSLLDCLSDCQPKVRSDLMSFLNITSDELAQEMALLREVGLNIQEENEIYQLLPEMPLLNPQAISTALFPYSVHYHRTISSTNEFISRQIEQLKKGDLCLAEYQTAGRGRRGRQWLSPFAGQLIFSFYWTIDPKKALDGLSLVIGLAIAEALNAKVKWPNDILVNGRKLVGILTEMSGSMEEISYIVMGIGVNVKTKQEELPEEIKQIATSLLMEGVDIERTEAFKIILEELEHQYYDVLDSGFEDTLNEWRKLSVTLNQEIEVRAPGNTYEGVATDIDDDGNLLVKTTNGEVKRIVAGDVSIRPRK